MPTIKQKQATENIVENGGNVSKAMLKAKYSPNTAKTPQKLTNSKGFKYLCDKAGFTKEFIVECLKEDIDNKPRYRATELQLGAKVLGMLNDKLDITSNGLNITFDNSFNEATQPSKPSVKPKAK